MYLTSTRCCHPDNIITEIGNDHRSWSWLAGSCLACDHSKSAKEDLPDSTGCMQIANPQATALKSFGQSNF